MPRRARGLTAAQVEKGTKPGRYGDGAGLYLLVRSRHAKFWLFRYTRSGRMREMGLGPAKGRAAVPLSQARAKARQLYKAGIRWPNARPKKPKPKPTQSKQKPTP